jgi:2-polyprenyl-6-hydroxyphenyl methylase/3-demethylubiquinone-9 3-methyltransferase
VNELDINRFYMGIYMMEKVLGNNQNRINNDLYNVEGDIWRQPESPFYLMQCSVNPARVVFFKRKLFTELNINALGKSALEVGCGGGILTEEIAHMGFDVIGIDPSEQSIKTAIEHANANGFRIRYEIGEGEALPYMDGTFDIIFCCDVLEHVHDVPKVISEIARVLKPGGLFCYDT